MADSGRRLLRNREADEDVAAVRIAAVDVAADRDRASALIRSGGEQVPGAAHGIAQVRLLAFRYDGEPGCRAFGSRRQEPPIRGAAALRSRFGPPACAGPWRR